MIEAGEIKAADIIEGESLDGFAARVAADNWLHRVRDISSIGGVEYAHRPQLATKGWDDLPALADVLDVPVSELELRSYPLLAEDSTRRAFFGTHLHRNDFVLRKRQFAPSALASEPYHRALWQTGLPFDIETGEILRSECHRPGCGKIQRWRHTAGIAHCDTCVMELATAPTSRVDSRFLEDLQRAVGLIHPDPAQRAESLSMLSTSLAELEGGYAFELLLRLLPVADGRCTWKQGTRWRHNDPHDLARGMSKAWKLLTGWPNAVLEKMSQDIAGTARRFSDGNGGANLRFLSLRNDRHLPECLRPMIFGLHDLINLKGPQADEVNSRSVGVKEASKMTGVDAVTLVRCRRSGGLQTIAVARQNVMVPNFDRAEMVEVAADIDRRASLVSASKPLGLPFYALEQLVAGKHLALLSHPFFLACYGSYQIADTAVPDLIDAITGNARPTRDTDITLEMAMHMVGKRLKPWNYIITQMLDGRLTYGVIDGDGAIFHRVSVDRKDFIRALGRDFTEPEQTIAVNILMSRRDAGEVLNLDPHQYTELFRSYPVRNVPVVPVGKVLELARRHISIAEVMARLGAGRKEARQRLGELNVIPMTAAGYDRIQVERKHLGLG